jgi:hypothetical protein
MHVVANRVQIVGSSAASLLLEGLRSSSGVDELLEAWARGDASDATLLEAERRILAGERLEGLLVPGAPAGAPRAA